jgi:hypothetical protein
MERMVSCWSLAVFKDEGLTAQFALDAWVLAFRGGPSWFLQTGRRVINAGETAIADHHKLRG